VRTAFILLAALTLLSAASATPHAAAQVLPTVAIDMNISGNDDSHVGNVQNCAQMARVGDKLTIDLVIMDVDPSVKIAGYQVDIDYDPKVIRINSAIPFDPAGSTPPNNVTMLSRIKSGGGAGFITLTEATPDSDGSFTAAAADGTGNPFPPDNHEDGEGVLTRMTIEAVGTGSSPLTIPGPKGGPDGNPDMIIIRGTAPFGSTVPVKIAYSGAVSVGRSCTPPPASTPLTPGGETPQPGTETPQPGASPGAGTPGANGSPAAGQTPGVGTPGAGTPGAGTPVLGGSPVSEDGSKGNDEGGGLSAAAWAGIAAAVAVAAAGAGGGWYFLRRRKAGPG